MNELPNSCYGCKYRGEIPGDSHSVCRHPKTGMAGDLMEDLVAMLSDPAGTISKAATEMGILLNAHGVRNGWCYWPANFDPIWVVQCNAFEPVAPAAEVKL